MNVAWRFLFFIVASSLFSFSHAQHAEKLYAEITPKALKEAPNEIRRAISLNAYLLKNELKTQLDQKLSGSIWVRLEIESKNTFQIYKDKFFVAAQTPELKSAKMYLRTESVPINFLDPISKQLKEGFKGQNIFDFEFVFNNQLSREESWISKQSLNVGIQACNQELCLLPFLAEVPIEASVYQPVKAAWYERLDQTLKSYLSEHSPLHPKTLILLLLAGLITALTPCVYPLYPITIGLFSKWSAHSHVSPLALALSYCAGLTLTYALLGLLSAATAQVFGSLTQSPFFLLCMGILLLYSSLSFAGYLKFPMPQKLLQIFGKARPSHEPTGLLPILGRSFVMGTGLGIVASPCVGPVLLALLGWVSTLLSKAPNINSYGLAFVLLGLFGVGMSLPFLFIGHFVIKLHRRPALGKLTPYVKHFGSIVLALSSLLYIVPALKLLIRPKRITNYPVFSYQQWAKDRPAILDFRADWCTACVQLEDETLSHPDIAPSFERSEVHVIKVDLTHMTPELQNLATQHKVLSLPSLLFFDKEIECENLRLNVFEEAKDFKKRMTVLKNHCLQD